MIQSTDEEKYRIHISPMILVGLVSNDQSTEDALINEKNSETAYLGLPFQIVAKRLNDGPKLVKIY